MNRFGKQSPSTSSFWTGLLALGLLGCGAASDGTIDESGTANGDGDGGSTVVADARFGECGAQTAEIPLVEINDPPDLLIVLDKSASMALPIKLGFPIPPTKWEVMSDAIESITTTYAGNIRFGLTVFPGDADTCGVANGADVNIDLNSGSDVNNWMDGHTPSGRTPAHLGLQNARSIYNGSAANAGGQYVLFATDGAPNCAGTPPEPKEGSEAETVAAVEALKSQGINTFVLGFGNLTGLDPDLLNDAAQAGGEAKTGGPPYFYHADDAASLEAALQDIAGGIIEANCSFQVTETPPDPDLVTVTIDGTAIPKDTSHNNGWDYHPDASTITFFGDSCDAVQQGDINVSFIFGCPGPSVN